MNRIIVSVSNDLFSDQRVDKVCQSLVAMGFEVLLVGRRYHDSPPLAPRSYQTKRLRLLFRKGFLFYAELNLRLFFFLLFHRYETAVANDLDTLLPNFVACRIKRKKIIYDSHEYFCGVPELNGRPRVQKFWRRIEQFCFPKLPEVITVCQSIADLYDQEYPRPSKVHVVRNVPRKETLTITKKRAELGLPADKHIIVMQGAINQDRGAEELILAIKEVADSMLLIIGDGDVTQKLQTLVRDEGLTDRVRLIPRMAPSELANYTAACDIGCSLEKDTNLNYRFCLPNKLFDYMKAGIPCVVSDLPEMSRIVRENQIGTVISEHSPSAIAKAINQLLTDKELYQKCAQNARLAAERYCWENEERILHDIYKKQQTK